MTTQVIRSVPRIIHHVGGQDTDNPVNVTDMVYEDRVIFDQSWFDKIQLNMREAGAGKVGIHVWKSGQSCRYLEADISALTKPDFFLKLYERAKVAWQKPDPHAKPCPNCGQDQRQHRRRYEGRAFCGFCGVGLDTVDYGKKLESAE